jgi:uncharacterized protein YbcV (DUF1398 family)
MSKAIENLEAAQRKAMAIRPKVGGFPYLAEALRQAGVRRNIWSLPSAQSLFFTNAGAVVTQGSPLVSGTVDVPLFDREALIAALRTDQAGNSTFPEFLAASWRAGVVRYDVDFSARTVSYYGCNGEEYVEKYPAVELGWGGTMRRERALKIVLVVVGRLFTAGVVPLTMFFSREPAVPMIMSIYVTLGIFLLLAAVIEPLTLPPQLTDFETHLKPKVSKPSSNPFTVSDNFRVRLCHLICHHIAFLAA